MSLREALAGGGGVKSIQTGYVNGTRISGAGEDSAYIDVTISAVNPAKCFVHVVGGASSAAGEGYYKSGSSGATDTAGRITSSTNLRLASPINAGSNISGRWTVVEYK